MLYYTGGDDVNRFGPVPKDVIIEAAVKKLEFNSKGYCFLISEDDKFFVLGFKKGKIDAHHRLRQILNEAKKWKTQDKNSKLHIALFGNDREAYRIMPKSRVIDEIAEKLEMNGDYEIEDIIGRCEILQRNSSVLVLFGKFQNNVNKFEELAKYSKYGVFGVIGNDCFKLYKSILHGEKVFDLHEKPQVIDDFIFIGQEGSSGDLGFVLYNEKEIQNHLNQQIKGYKDKKIILLSHSPPYGILDTAIRFTQGGSIGSLAIKKFIEKNRVILNICGHAHYMGGKYVKYGKPTIVNIASHDNPEATGKIAIIEINKEELNVELIELPPSNLRAIWGIGPAYSSILEKVGIKRIKDFVLSNPEDIAKKTNLSLKTIQKWYLRAKSLFNKETILLEPIVIENPIFVDIETDHMQSFVWMICVFDPNKNIFKQFTAYKNNERKKILKDFLEFISTQQYTELYSYSGTNFEKRVLLSQIEKYKLDGKKFPIFMDLLYKISDVLIVPLATYKLKELGTFLGFKWKHPDIDGFVAPILYNQFLKSKDRKIIRKLQEYNKDDVLVLWHILQKIKKMQIGKPYSSLDLQNL